MDHADIVGIMIIDGITATIEGPDGPHLVRLFRNPDGVTDYSPLDGPVTRDMPSRTFLIHRESVAHGDLDDAIEELRRTLRPGDQITVSRGDAASTRTETGG